MATYKVADVQDKNADWKVISIEMSEGNFQEDVSVNRKSKKEGEGDFPNFDQIVPGYTVSGELWQSGTGKWYLFAPRAPKATTGGQGGGMKGAAALQNKKHEHMDKLVDRKEDGFKLSATMRDTTMLLTTFFPEIAQMEGMERTEEIKLKFKALRDWYLKTYDETEKMIDVPFN